jgi:hypothetical protein
MHAISILAYIDPMAGSLVLQTIVAAIVGAAFLCRRFVTRFGSLFRVPRLTKPPAADVSAGDP